MSRFAVTAVVLVLVAGTAAAFAVTERLKLQRSPVTPAGFDRQFSPVCRCETARARLRVSFRRPEVVTATIVDGAGEVVRTLAVRERVLRGPRVYVWDGLTDRDVLAADGRYLLRLRFEEERRAILVPIPVRLDTKAPGLRGVELRPAVISPDGDGRRDRLRVRYQASERHTAELRVDGRRVAASRTRPPRQRHALQWLGRFVERTDAGEERIPAKEGEYELTLVVRDLAGNAAVRRFAVRIRFVELDRAAYEAQPGSTLTFVVDTDVREFAWYLHRPRRGRFGQPVLWATGVTEHAVAVRIPADARPGTYILRVVAGDRKTRATVAVTRAAP